MNIAAVARTNLWGFATVAFDGAAMDDAKFHGLRAIALDALSAGDMRPDAHTTVHVNAGEPFEIGGPARHAGLTGRKIGIDAYGEIARQSGSALSGRTHRASNAPALTGAARRQEYRRGGPLPCAAKFIWLMPRGQAGAHQSLSRDLRHGYLRMIKSPDASPRSWFSDTGSIVRRFGLRTPPLRRAGPEASIFRSRPTDISAAPISSSRGKRWMSWMRLRLKSTPHSRRRHPATKTPPSRLAYHSKVIAGGKNALFDTSATARRQRARAPRRLSGRSRIPASHAWREGFADDKEPRFLRRGADARQGSAVLNEHAARQRRHFDVANAGDRRQALGDRSEISASPRRSATRSRARPGMAWATLRQWQDCVVSFTRSRLRPGRR